MHLPTPSEATARSVLGRASALTKLFVAVAWLAGLVVTLDPRVPVVLAVAAVAGAVSLGRVPLGAFLRGAAPLWVAAIVIGVFNALFAGANTDPLATEIARIGPFRLTEPAVIGGLAIALRVVAIGATSVAFARTTDPTGLADSLVQQARAPERFAYGALAAYQALPRLSGDLLTLRQARRIRGLRTSWHPGVLVGLLALAVRHGDRVAVAMDARAFSVGPRTHYRTVRWTSADGAVAACGVAALALALLVTRL